MKYKLRFLSIFILLVLVLLPVGTVWAACPPNMPVLFKGDVFVGGSPAVDGTSITLWQGATEVGSATTSGGKYSGIGVCPDDYGGLLIVGRVDGEYGGEAICPTSAIPPTFTLNLNVTIVTEPNIWVTPTTKNFGDVQVGTKSPAQTFDVGNSGDADLDVYEITLTGSDPDQFEITYDAVSWGTFPPMTSDELQVKFTPDSSGTKTAILSIPSNDPDTPTFDVNLRGRGSSEPPTPTNVLVQVAFLLDSSGSIGSGNWAIIVNGLADAVDDSDCFPHNGSVELTVVRFGSSADTPVGPVVITPSNVDGVADDIRDIAYLSAGSTCISCAFDEAADQLRNSPNFSRSVKQAINLVTDGYPASKSASEAARDDCIDDLDMTENQDVICAEAIGSGADVDWLRDYIVYPQPGCDWPIGDSEPDCNGWVREVEDAEEFADTICEKLEAILVTPITCDFTAMPRRGMTPLTVQFSNLSTGPIDSVSWDFGDGKTSTQQNPRHIYYQPGKYDVTLLVNGDSTECEIIMENYIDVLPDLVEEEGPNLAAAYLLVSPEEGRPGQEFEISINVGNDGGTTGTRSIALYLNGVLEQSQTVSVGPGSSKLLVFRVTKWEPGVYQVLLEGNEGQFTVIEQEDQKFYPGPLGTPGIIVIVVVAVVLIGAIVFVFMRRE